MSDPNYRVLWKRLRGVYEKYGLKRKMSVLDNHANKQAQICKKLGVVCGADINRIDETLRLDKDKKTR